MKKKILVLYTGGTVGMDYTENGLMVVPGLFPSQIKSLAPITNVELELIEYADLIDSSDINLSHWVQIIQDITTNHDKYDGFVIIHGTDTMAYTASMLSFALIGLKKPVILTGAQLPLVHRRSDGWSNIIDAIYSAMQEEFYEVAIAFNHKLFRGCRAQKVSTNKFIGFDSVDEEPLAEFGIDILWHKRRWLKLADRIFAPVIPLDINILCLSLRPGYTTDFIAQTLNNTNAKAVVLEMYGSGTIPLSHKVLVDAIKNATQRGVLVLGITQVIEGRVANEYANSRLDSLGVISGYDMTPEAALAKLWVLFSMNLTNAQIKSVLDMSMVGELTKVI